MGKPPAPSFDSGGLFTGTHSQGGAGFSDITPAGSVFTTSERRRAVLAAPFSGFKLNAKEATFLVSGEIWFEIG